MKLFGLFILTLTLSACSSSPVRYFAMPEKNKTTAMKIIEQVVMEQPSQHRPQGMNINDEYLGLDYGTKTRSNNVSLGLGIHHWGVHHSGLHTGLSTRNLVTKTKSLNERIYHSSISAISLYKRGNYYFAAIRGESGKIAKRIYSVSKKKTVRFADAMYYFVNNASDNFK